MASIHRQLLKDLGLILKAKHIWIKKPVSRRVSTAAMCCQKSALYSAVCVQRLPVISPALNSIESRFSDLLSKIELENSHLSDFEIRMITEAKMAKNLKELDEDDKTGGDVETALDLQDKWEAEVKAFVPAPRETEADRTNNLRTVDRKLDSSLYLLVKQNIEGRDHWVLPQAVWEQGETLRQTAERALTALCGQVKTTFLGNAPCAVAKFDPKEKVDRNIKLFFFQAWYIGGEITPNKTEATDYLWVTRKELSNYCHASYRNHLKKFIFDL
ncbi:hypothetical protein BsWGS_13913 [Bradybaena similaris]